MADIQVVAVERKIKTANRSELARTLNVNRSHVSQVLSGKSVPSLSVAARMARELGISLDQLWGYLQTASVN